MISAVSGDGVRDLTAYLAERLPEGPWMYPGEQVSDMPEYLLTAEITREQLYRQLRRESLCRHGGDRVLGKFQRWRRKDRSNHHIERWSQKGIVMGNGESHQIHPRSAKGNGGITRRFRSLVPVLEGKGGLGRRSGTVDTWALISTLEKSSFFASYSAHDTRRPAFLSYSFRGRFGRGRAMAFDSNIRCMSDCVILEGETQRDVCKQRCAGIDHEHAKTKGLRTIYKQCVNACATDVGQIRMPPSETELHIYFSYLGSASFNSNSIEARKHPFDAVPPAIARGVKSIGGFQSFSHI